MHGLWVDAAADLVVAGVFAVLGLRIVTRRGLEGTQRRAVLAFGSWWLLFAVRGLLTFSRTVLVGMGFTDADLHEAIWVVEIAASVLALWGVAAYIEYLKHGSTVNWLAWAVAVGALAVLDIAVVLFHDVASVFPRHWSAGRTFTTEPPLWLRLVLVGAYYGLMVVLVARMAVLVRHAGDRTEQLRANTLLWGVILIAVVGFLVLAIPGGGPLGPLQSSLLVTGAAIVWFGYFPPEGFRKAVGVRSWREDTT